METLIQLRTKFFHSFEDRDKIFYEQLKKTGAGYFDYYLLHGIEASLLGKFEEFDCFNWLLEKKAQGLVKHVGFSYHDSADLLDEILTRHPEMDFVQLQINYLDWENEFVHSKLCNNASTRHGKPVIVMEPVKGGMLARVPAKAETLLKKLDDSLSVPSWAVRFAASLPNVMIVLSGMRSIEQVDDNTSFMQDFSPLTQSELQILEQVSDIIRNDIKISCTGCSYCTEGCPEQIAIPKYFTLYNEDKQEGNTNNWTPNKLFYNQLVAKFGKASQCIQCGQCENVCPQHLTIIDYLKKVSAHFE